MKSDREREKGRPIEVWMFVCIHPNEKCVKCHNNTNNAQKNSSNNVHCTQQQCIQCIDCGLTHSHIHMRTQWQIERIACQHISFSELYFLQFETIERTNRRTQLPRKSVCRPNGFFDGISTHWRNVYGKWFLFLCVFFRLWLGKQTHSWV